MRKDVSRSAPCETEHLIVAVQVVALLTLGRLLHRGHPLAGQ